MRGFNGVLTRNGVETVSIFDKDHLRKVHGKRVYLHCDILEAVKDITEKYCVEWFQSMRTACRSLEPLSGPAYLCFSMKTYAVELAHFFLPGSRVAQQMGYRLSETAFQAMAKLSSNGKVRLKPSLRHSKHGQKMTGVYKSASQFCGTTWKNSPNAVVICQPNISPFIEVKFACFGSELCPFIDPESLFFQKYRKRIHQLFGAVLVFLQKKFGHVPPLWRLDLVLHEEELYLNEIESPGALY